MAERLVIISDMWGAKKGLWITSYLGYLQQYFDIVFYDSQQLANLDLKVNSEENIHNAFVEGGIDTAVTHLAKKEKVASHYLAFSVGGTIAWKAANLGMPMKSLYTVSATRIRMEDKKPEVPTRLIFGKNDAYKPSSKWEKKLGVEVESVENFGHTMYTDEKIIKKVCKDLLDQVTKLPKKNKKAV
ncbi:hypothetical protein [uncultured Maribacter sp.]|uniref:hypothetical protein n=1 Tax=uncultured Maribacter sp. TaxID=431308 RepID=UPI0026084288|nr:hypothetical protein [uncultured Maribacter sp.]